MKIQFDFQYRASFFCRTVLLLKIIMNGGDGVEKNQILNGRYQIEKRIPAGSSNQIYVALDKRDNRRVIVKSFRSKLVWDLINTESASLLEMSSDYIPKVFEVGMFDGECCIIEELVEGEKLNTFLASKELTFNDFFGIINGLLDALFEMHYYQLVHGDVKPQNIFVRNVKGRNVGILMDIDSAFMHQKTKKFYGSLPYAAPEQIIENKYPFGADIYALGMVAYYMLEGKLPYKMDEEGLWQKVNGSKRLTLTKLHDQFVKEDIELLLNEMVDVNPDNRPSIISIKKRLQKNEKRILELHLGDEIINPPRPKEPKEDNIEKTLDVPLNVQSGLSLKNDEVIGRNRASREYGEKLMKEYEMLNGQAKTVFRLWVATFILGMLIIILAVFMICIGKFQEALLATALEALLYFAQKCFSMREDDYRAQNENKLKHLEAGDYYEYAMNMLETTDQEFRKKIIALLIETLRGQIDGLSTQEIST